jgi:hypothetical protein
MTTKHHGFRMLLNAGVKPLDYPGDALKVRDVLLRRECAPILGPSERTIRMRLRQVYKSSDFLRCDRIRVPSNQGVNHSGFPDAGNSFDKQSFEWNGGWIAHRVPSGRELAADDLKKSTAPAMVPSASINARSIAVSSNRLRQFAGFVESVWSTLSGPDARKW